MASPEKHLTEDQLLAAAEGEALAASVRDHLADCERCTRDVTRMQAAVAAIRAAPQPRLSAELRQDLVQRFERKRGRRRLLPGILTWRMPVYQAAGLAAAAVILWSLFAGPRPRVERTALREAGPAFHAATADGMAGGSFFARYVAAPPDSV
jgi:anti-sigma factor RsiW